MIAQLSFLAEILGVVAVTMLLGLSPLFKRRPLVFKYPRREVAVSLGLALLLLAGLWLIYSRMTVIPPTVLTTAPFSTTQLIQQVLIALFIAVPVAAALIIRGQPARSAGLGSQTLRPSIQLAIALGVITIFLRGKIYNILDGISPSEFYLLLAMLAIGFAEEFAFRGYIQPRLSGWIGERWGWVATALIFTLVHIPDRILAAHLASPTDLALSLLDLLVLGLLLGWIMRKSGNLLAPGLYHAIHLWVMYI